MKWQKRFLLFFLFFWLYILLPQRYIVLAQETSTDQSLPTVSERLQSLLQSLDELERLSTQQALDLNELSEELKKLKTEIAELESLLAQSRQQSASLSDTLQKCKAQLQTIEQRVVLWQIVSGVEAGAIIALIILYLLK